MQSEQRRHEATGIADALAEHAFPERNRRVAAGRHDATGSNAQARAERRKGRRALLVEARQHVEMLREKLERLIVERGERMTHQGRAAVADDRGDELVGVDRPAKNRAIPGTGGQWYRHARCGPGPRARRIGLTAAQVREGRSALRRLRVEQAGQLGHEPRAIAGWIQLDQSRNRRNLGERPARPLSPGPRPGR